MTNMLEETFQNTSTVARYSQLTPEQFEQQIEAQWKALEQVKEVAKAQVRQGNLTPLQAVGIVACASGQTFGYQEFHGQPGPADLIAKAIRGDSRN